MIRVLLGIISTSVYKYMGLKNFIKSKRNIGYLVLLSVVIFGCLWAFIYSGIITQSFKDKIVSQTYNNQEAEIENLLVTETKEGEKLWELYAEKGTYSDQDSIVFLEDLIGNFYDNNKVKASFKADNGTYNSKLKEIKLFNNVILVYDDGTNITTDRLEYKGKNEDIIAQGNIRIEKPNEVVIFGSKAILKGDFSDFNIEGRTKTQFYM